MNFPNHLEHVRTDTGFSYERGQRRTDATESEVAAMAKAMGQTAPDPERDAHIARLKSEGQSPDHIKNWVEGYDLAMKREDVSTGKYAGLKAGTEASRQKQTEIVKKAEEAKRSDSRDAEIMGRAMRAGAPIHVAPVMRSDARDGRRSAAERARQANETRTRTAWQGPQQAPETRQDDARAQHLAAHSDGSRLSASERAKRENEDRQRNAWQRR